MVRLPRLRRSPSLLSVVVPAYDVAAYLPACLDSVLAQSASLGPVGLEVVVVDDGSPDDVGAIAESYAARDPRVRVVHIENRGLGAARNEGLRHVTGDLLMFADSDDVVPPGAYAALLRQLTRTGADFVTGSVARLEAAGLVEPPWMKRLHRQRMDLVVDDLPEILGDVFAWNKLFRTSFWRSTGLSWPEGVRYEDQPTTTLAYLRARRFGIVPEVVYHWRIRSDGTSICATAGRPSSPRSARRRSTAPRRSPRPSATGSWPATCTATSPSSPAATTSGGRCCTRA
jgi:glycosyltransferase involved in cell wall biosynthesis